MGKYRHIRTPKNSFYDYIINCQNIRTPHKQITVDILYTIDTTHYILYTINNTYNGDDSVSSNYPNSSLNEHFSI